MDQTMCFIMNIFFPSTRYGPSTETLYSGVVAKGLTNGLLLWTLKDLLEKTVITVFFLYTHVSSIKNENITISVIFCKQCWSKLCSMLFDKFGPGDAGPNAVPRLLQIDAVSFVIPVLEQIQNRVASTWWDKPVLSLIIKIPSGGRGGLFILLLTLTYVKSLPKWSHVKPVRLWYSILSLEKTYTIP